jgi:ABC-type nitrate/sulfonate/bicarbonate transport system permease component
MRIDRATLSRIARFALVPIVGVAVWQLIIYVFTPAPYLLPPPGAVFRELADAENRFLYHSGQTGLVALSGFLIANTIALVLGAVLSELPRLRAFVLPYAITLKTAPVIALAPILVLWFRFGIGARIATATVISFFPVLINALEAFRLTDDASLDLFRALRATRWQIFWRLKFPSAVPVLFAGFKISSALSVVGAIVGEFVNPAAGLGSILVRAQTQMSMDRVFAALLCSAAIGLLFYGLLHGAQRVVAHWHKPPNLEEPLMPRLKHGVVHRR